MGAAQSVSTPCVLHTPKGSLKGIEQCDLSGQPVLRRYTRVRYAQPPVGKLRWRRPQPLPIDHGFNDANGEPGDYTEFGSICPQPPYDHKKFFFADGLQEASFWMATSPSEDCLFVNIWVPAGTAPRDGWPVQIYIHGGFLQVGNANQDSLHDPFDLMVHSTPRIIVAVTYRINLFGFLAGPELASLGEDPAAGNYGFWDQRAAIEWVHENITFFGGDAANMTVGGLSAGAYSAFFQLYYDVHRPPSERLIKRCYLFSNALAIQPPKATSSQLTSQFESLCSTLGIPRDIPGAEKIARLRAVPFADLVAAIPRLPYHVFRACTDGEFAQGGFVPASFLSSLHDGSFTTAVASQGVQLLLGEVRDEALLYEQFSTPTSRDSLILQLCNDYPRAVVDALLSLPMYEVPTDPDSLNTVAWARSFARIRADMQVHCSMRGLVHCLLSPPKRPGVVSLKGHDLFRYRISWRARAIDDLLRPCYQVLHSADIPIWWASGFRAGYTAADRQSAQGMLEPFGRFVVGEAEIGWGGDGGETTLRYLDEDGQIFAGWQDSDWERCMLVWDTVWKAQRDNFQAE